jgi:hypothetical protein
MSDDWVNEWNRPNAGDFTRPMFTEADIGPWQHLCLECGCFWAGDDVDCPACGWAPEPSPGSFTITGITENSSVEIIEVEKGNLVAPAFGGCDPLLHMIGAAVMRGEDPAETLKGATVTVRLEGDDVDQD